MMNRIEITTDGKGWVVHQDGKNSGQLCYGEMLEQVIALMPPYNGKHYPMKTEEEWASAQLRLSQPDRVSITLTEREAELVMNLTNPWFGPQTASVFNALYGVGFFPSDDLDWSDCPLPQRYSHGAAGTYAHAEQLHSLTRQPSLIRLTMDRDVAVTLKHLLNCVDPMGELKAVFSKLQVAGVWLHGGDPIYGGTHGPSRFTGEIRWKKKRLTMCECEIGKTYKKVGVQEWEQVE